MVLAEVDIVHYTVDALRKGQVIAYPTDSIWGLGSDVYCLSAYRRILTMKKRGFDKKLILLVSSWDMLKRYVSIIPAVVLACPPEEPTTFIYGQTRGLPAWCLSADGSVAIRVVQRGFAHEMINLLGRPVTSTSVNFAGDPPILSGREVALLNMPIDYIVPLEVEGTQKPSAIYSVQGEHTTRLR